MIAIPIMTRSYLSSFNGTQLVLNSEKTPCQEFASLLSRPVLQEMQCSVVMASSTSCLTTLQVPNGINKGLSDRLQEAYMPEGV